MVDRKEKTNHVGFEAFSFLSTITINTPYMVSFFFFPVDTGVLIVMVDRKEKADHVGFEVFTAATMKNAVKTSNPTWSVFLSCPPLLSIPRVDASKHASTVIPANRKRRRKGNPVVSDETLMYGYESSATLTTDRLHYKLQTRPLLREGAPRRRTKQFSGKRQEKVKSGHGPQRGTRHQDILTDLQSQSNFNFNNINMWLRRHYVNASPAVYRTMVSA
jgi:hypothetical protein